MTSIRTHLGARIDVDPAPKHLLEEGDDDGVLLSLRMADPGDLRRAFVFLNREERAQLAQALA